MTMPDQVRYDDKEPFYIQSTHGDCSAHVGDFKLVSKLKRNDYEDEETGNDRSEWGMFQRGFMWPWAANYSDFDIEYFGEQPACWVNDWAELTQNWRRSELSDLGVWDWDPTFSDETKTSLDTSLSVSAPKSVGVSVSVDFPKLKIESDLGNDQEKLKSTYEFQNWLGGNLAAADENVKLGTVTAFDSRKPDSGDKVAPTYMYGRFKGPELLCEVTGCGGARGDRQEGASTFNWFYEYEIDDL